MGDCPRMLNVLAYRPQKVFDMSVYMIHPSYIRTLVRPLIAPFVIMIGINLAWAGLMVNDPKGFHDIPWGTFLSSRLDLELVRSSPHIVEYFREEQPSSFHRG